jgi:hypothetical protein
MGTIYTTIGRSSIKYVIIQGLTLLSGASKKYKHLCQPIKNKGA